MNEHPVLLKAETVRAILDGRKTQTRQPIEPQPPEMPGKHDGLHGQDASGEWWFCRDGKPLGPWRCPFGMLGDLFSLHEISLRVKRVWVERVQDITLDDIYAEGVRNEHYNRGSVGSNYSVQNVLLPELWDSIYAKHGLGRSTNPWVWACKFEVVE